MKKEELAKQYADPRIKEAGKYYSCDFNRLKTMPLFDGWAIEQAYEDGFDKAVEVACELIERLHLEIAGYPVCLPDQFVEDFKANMEEEV